MEAGWCWLLSLPIVIELAPGTPEQGDRATGADSGDDWVGVVVDDDVDGEEDDEETGFARTWSSKSSSSFFLLLALSECTKEKERGSIAVSRSKILFSLAPWPRP